MGGVTQVDVIIAGSRLRILGSQLASVTGNVSNQRRIMHFAVKSRMLLCCFTSCSLAFSLL